jgi:hypothetical protein
MRMAFIGDRGEGTVPEEPGACEITARLPYEVFPADSVAVSIMADVVTIGAGRRNK